MENNIKIEIKEIGLDGVKLIHLVQDRDRLQAVVNTVIILQVHKRQRIALLDERLTAFQEHVSVKTRNVTFTC
jgi:hypothetical protein